MGRAEEPCLHSPMSLPVLYPLYKCAEIKRNASEKRELQGNRELAARPSGSAVIAKCQSAVCQQPPPPPQPQKPSQRRVVGLPAVLATGTDRAGLLWGRQGFFLPSAFIWKLFPFLSL